jgi:hypothetical protein
VNRMIGLLASLGIVGWLSAAGVAAQAPSEQNAPQQRQGRGRQEGEGGPRPLFGKITSIKDGVIGLARPDGQTVIVKVTDQTEYRKDQQAAKAADFKVGDTVMVRGDENPDHSVTAKMIGARTGGVGGPGGGPAGTLGKDYVVGEVKAIDAPRLTVLRPDNVTQTMELNEGTSLRKGRESITMADIQVGDHVMARGAVANDVFVPKGVMVMGPEQWKRIEEMGTQNGGRKPAAPEATPPKTEEKRN